MPEKPVAFVPDIRCTWLVLGWQQSMSLAGKGSVGTARGQLSPKLTMMESCVMRSCVNADWLRSDPGGGMLPCLPFTVQGLVADITVSSGTSLSLYLPTSTFPILEGGPEVCSAQECVLMCLKVTRVISGTAGE